MASSPLTLILNDGFEGSSGEYSLGPDNDLPLVAAEIVDVNDENDDAALSSRGLRRVR